jgi:hypothetical protein
MEMARLKMICRANGFCWPLVNPKVNPLVSKTALASKCFANHPELYPLNQVLPLAATDRNTRAMHAKLAEIDD